MALQSMFDLGTCLVKVTKSGATFYSNAVGKGGSATFEGFYGASEQLRVDVSIGGVVTLTNLDGSTDLADGYILSVTPLVSFTGIVVISDISAWIVSGSQLGGNAAAAAIGTEVDLNWIGPQPGTCAADPDPVQFSSILYPNYASVYMGAAI